jgi:hypothetical protein
MILPLEDVRSLAASHDYKEIQHNPTSRVIIFRSNSTTNNGSMQINVYYTTGTVGTCLNHPKQGKTQLFRRGILNLEMLSDIFQNPRIHTGVGYKLRKHMNMWQPTAAHTKESNSIHPEQESEAECDLVRRWRYVCAAMDLGKSLSSQQTDDNNDNDNDNNDNGDEARILRFCKLWNNLEFSASVDSSQRENSRTGADCNLFSLLFVAAKMHHRVKGVFMRYENDEHDREPTLFHIEYLIGCHCAEGVQFASEFSSELLQAATLLGEFSSSKTREELLVWFFDRMSPGNSLVRVKLVEEEDGPEPEFLYNREDLNAIHCEYSKLYYPKKSNLCPCHGYSKEKESSGKRKLTGAVLP